MLKLFEYLRAASATTAIHALLIAVMSIGPITNVAAAEPPMLSQYAHTAWREQDGGVRGPNAVAQTRDGYLWIGTDAGVVRFDGVRFLSTNSFEQVSTAQWQVATIFVASDDSVWIGGNAHLARIKNKRLVEQYTIVGRVNQFAEGKDGLIWFTQTRASGKQGPVCSVSNKALHCYGKPDIPYTSASALSADANGTLWFGGDEGLCHWSPGHPAACYLHEMLGPTYGLVGVMAILRTKDGTQWLGIAKSGHSSYGLGRLVDSVWKPFVKGGFDGGKLDVSQLMEDSDGSLWVGTYGDGLYKIRGDRVDHFTHDDGLTDNAIEFLYQDVEGSVWVVTDGGLDFFRTRPIETFSVLQGLPAYNVSSVLAAREGTVWIGNRPLTALRDDKPVGIPLSEALRGTRTTSLLEDHLGRVWIGEEGALHVWDSKSKSLRAITDSAGHPTGPVRVMIEDTSHDVWILTTAPQRLLRVRDFLYQEQPSNQLIRTLAPDPSDGIWLALSDKSTAHLLNGEVATLIQDDASIGNVNGLLVEADGTMLAATSRGLLIRRGSEKRLIDIKHGLPCDIGRAVVRDSNRDVWLLLSCGIVRIESGEIDRLLAAPESTVRFRLFDSSDGFQPDISGFSPVASVAPDGRIWFATNKVVQVIDPKRVTSERRPPPVQIDELVADRVPYSATDRVLLPQGTRDIEIRYAALSFITPRKIQFRYRLDGRDGDWVDAGARREVFYTDLPPGSYRLRVAASNGDGVWSETAASINFNIKPAFYQTKWFIVICTLLAASLIFGLYLFRLHQLATRYRDRLAARISERERIARDLHDTLLQSTEGLILLVQAASNGLPKESPVRAAIERALARASALIAEGRDRVQDLRSSGVAIVDLPKAIGALGDALASQHAAEFNLHVEGDIRATSSSVGDQAYLIAREAIVNAFRHANADVINVWLKYADYGLTVRVHDDGVGADLTACADFIVDGHWGVKGMQERAQRIGAQFDIRSRLGEGTAVELNIPARSAFGQERRWFRRLWSNRTRSD